MQSRLWMMHGESWGQRSANGAFDSRLTTPRSGQAVPSSKNRTAFCFSFPQKEKAAQGSLWPVACSGIFLFLPYIFRISDGANKSANFL
jgi:hypothetical protein